MTITLKEVTTQKDLKQFIHFPLKLYRNHPYFVPAMLDDEFHTLRQDKNPAFAHCEAKYWLAFDERNQVVGRVAGIINNLHTAKWGQHYARFGWLDFVDNPAVAAALMAAVEAWAKEKGKTALHGPMGFTNLDHQGMLVEGFDELATNATLYNHPYYPQMLEALGYIKDIDYVEYEMAVPDALDAKYETLVNILQKRYHLKTVHVKNKRELLKYGKAVFELLNQEYKALYGVVPLTAPQIEQYIQQYFGLVSADFLPLVVDENDKLVAFGVALPSLSKALQKSKGRLLPFGFLHMLHALKKNDRMDLYLIAVRSDYRGKGVNAILIWQVFQLIKKMKIKWVESNPELETNDAVQSQWKHFNRRQHKRRRIYLKTLE